MTIAMVSEINMLAPAGTHANANAAECPTGENMIHILW